MFSFILRLNSTHKSWVFSEPTVSERDVAIPENRSVSLKVTTWRHAQCLQLFKSRHCLSKRDCLSVPSLLAAWLSSSQSNYSDSCCCCPTKARNSMIVSWLPLDVCWTRIVASRGVIASSVPFDCLFKIIWQLHQFIVCRSAIVNCNSAIVYHRNEENYNNEFYRRSFSIFMIMIMATNW